MPGSVNPAAVMEITAAGFCICYNCLENRAIGFAWLGYRGIHVRGKRIAREKITIEKMILLYCRAKHHSGDALCDDCRTLLDYARQRLNCCRFGEQKPVCGDCTVHCYRPDLRARVIDIMRFAGPRMMFRHPWLAVLHLLDSWKRRQRVKRK